MTVEIRTKRIASQYVFLFTFHLLLRSSQKEHGRGPVTQGHKEVVLKEEIQSRVGARCRRGTQECVRHDFREVWRASFRSGRRSGRSASAASAPSKYPC